MFRLSRAAIVLLLSLVAVCVTEESATARIYYVSKRGKDRNSGTSANKAFLTLSRVCRESLTYGDVVYIGAGTYRNTMAVQAFSASGPVRGGGRGKDNDKDKKKGKKKGGGDDSGTDSGTDGETPSSNRPLRIVADTTGRFTGARGPVVVAVANRWAATVANAASVQFEGLVFGPSSMSGRYDGVSANGPTASVTVINCTFRNVSTGVLASQGRLLAIGCTFAGNAYGISGSNATSCYLQNCSFTNATSMAAVLHTNEATVQRCSFEDSQYGLYVRGFDSSSSAALNAVSISNCTYGLYGFGARITLADDDVQIQGCTYGVVLNQCRSDIAGLQLSGGERPVAIYGGEARLDGIEIAQSTSYGLYTEDIEKLELTRGQFSQTGDWAVYAHGSNLSVSDSRFDRTTYGLYVQEVGQAALPTLRQLSFSECTYGLQCDNSLVEFSDDNKLTFSDCVHGISLLACRSQLRRLDLSGGQRPLNLYGGTALIDGLTIRQAGSIGVYSSEMDQLSISNSDFGAVGSWAVVAHGKNLSVSSSTFTGSQDGLYVLETTGEKNPELDDLVFSECVGTGLQVSSSSIDLTARSNIRVSRCGYGIYLEDCTSSLSGLRLSSSNIPLYMKGGSCDLDGVAIENAASYGLLADGMLTLTAKNLTCTGAQGWGVHCNGRSLSLSDVTISSCGHGVALDGQGSNSPIPLANVEISDNLGYGLYVTNASFNVAADSTLKIANNGDAGLYLSGIDIELDGDSGIELTGNGIGIYADRTNVRLSGFTLKGNEFGVLQHYGKLECRDSLINGGRNGISQTDSPECVLQNTHISAASSWGLELSNSLAKDQRIILEDCSIRSCGGGLKTTMLNDGVIQLSGSSIDDNGSHGIYSRRGTSTLSKMTIVGNGGYGVIHYDGLLDVSDSKIEDCRSHGVMGYGDQNPGASRVVARRNRVKRNAGGIFAFRVSDAELVNNVSAGNVEFGVAVDVSGNGVAKIWNNSIVDNPYGVWHQGGTGNVRNNIIANGDLKASRSDAYGIYCSGGKVDGGNNLFFGQQKMYFNTPPGAGDVIKPPRFVNHAKGDYRLAAGSPAINAGTSTVGLTAVDIQGLSRPSFGAFEIGAFEYSGKSGSVRILDWGERAVPPRSTDRNSDRSFKTMLR